MMALCAPLRRILTSLWTTPRNIPRCWKAAISRLSLTLTPSPAIWTPGFLGEMDEEQLDKLADDMGVDTTGKDKAEVVAAVAEEPVEVPDISKMKLDELKEFAKDNGIDLTGCTTKASILQKIREYEADAAAAAAIIARRADGRTAVGHAGGTQRVHRI